MWYINIKFSLTLFFFFSHFWTSAQWDEVYSPLISDGGSIRGMSFINDSTGFIAIYDGESTASNLDINIAILKTEDYGLQWDTIYSYGWDCPCNFNEIHAITDIHFLDELNGLYTVHGNGIFAQTYLYRTFDGGYSWIPIETFLPGFERIEFINDQFGFVYSYYSYGMETYDGGETWEPSEYAGVYDVSFSDECNGIEMTSGVFGELNECEWNEHEFPTLFEDPSRSGTAVEYWSDQEYILGAMGNVGFSNFTSVLRTINGGESYSILDIPFGYGPGPFYFMNDSVGFFSTSTFSSEFESLYKTFDKGITWFGMPTPLTQLGFFTGFREIQCFNDTLCYAINGSSVYRSFNGGGPVGENMWTGVEVTKEELNDLHLFPNPTEDMLSFQTSLPIEYWTVTDMTGRVILTEGRLQQSMEDEWRVDVSSLAPGTYLLQCVLVDGRVLGKRFVK